jgi:hypothetical protein
VEVDTHKPTVKVLGVVVGRGADTGNLTITWTATDKHLSRQSSVALFYAAQNDGEVEGTWVPIESGRVDNTGRHVWRMPPDVPLRFLVRVDAVDQAGNVGSDTFKEPVVVDLVQPKGVIIGVEPLGGGLPSRERLNSSGQ